MFKDTVPTTERMYNWGDIEGEVRDSTPNENDFDDVYSKEEIEADKAYVQKIKDRLDIEPEQGISDSRIQEYATAQEIGEMDWFGEDKRRDELFPDGKGYNSSVFLTSEYDDYVNHIDAVCLMTNANSEFRTVPFALDVTYNTDREELDKKMAWRHPAREVKLSGFATAKYFVDEFNDKPLVDKGRIGIMPRFVIGFSPELSTEITELRMSGDGWGSMRRDELTAKAKWCVLKELKNQSEQMLEYLEGYHGDNEALERMLVDVRALDRYFGGAIEAAQEMDRDHPDWKSYPERDTVFGEIMSRRIV